MKELRFYKAPKGTWWLDSEEYIKQGGDPRDLQMVLGADDLLEKLSENKQEVRLELSEDKANGHLLYVDALRRIDEIPAFTGKYYHDDTTETIIWLCPVTTWVFNGIYPETIWYKKL